MKNHNKKKRTGHVANNYWRIHVWAYSCTNLCKELIWSGWRATASINVAAVTVLSSKDVCRGIDGRGQAAPLLVSTVINRSKPRKPRKFAPPSMMPGFEVVDEAAIFGAAAVGTALSFSWLCFNLTWFPLRHEPFALKWRWDNAINPCKNFIY